MNRHLAGFSCLMGLGLVVSPAGAADIKVMTQNQYLGADLTPVLAATTPEEFNAAMVDALQTIAANRPAERVKALAANIAKEQPAVVGLQEVYVFACMDYPFTAPGTGCTDPAIAGAFSDHLLGTLSALGPDYAATAMVVNLDIPALPFMVNGVPALLSVVDRDVILTRSSLGGAAVDYTVFQPAGICVKPSAEGCRYSNVATAPTPLGPISVERGFAAVDVSVDGKLYRVVNTHLEQQQPDPANPLSQALQAAQAAELLAVLSFTTPAERSLIVLGDMNSAPEHVASIPVLTPYQQFVGAGYADAWMLRPGHHAGHTCCQVEDLSNHQAALYERIDMLFAREIPQRVKKARVVGGTVAAKTSPPGRGLWPSDHGSVSAELQY